MKTQILPALLAIILLGACGKKETTPATTDQFALQQKAMEDFTTVVALPLYADLENKAAALRSAVTAAISTTPDNSKLDAARAAWRDLRAVWEQCEGFLFGPVEDGEYDPRMDTWPGNYTDMDQLLAGTQPLTAESVSHLDLSLRGFHPIEYMLFGRSGYKSIDSLSARQKEYLAALAEDLYENCYNLRQAWLPAGGNYAAAVTSAGSGSSLYATRQQVFLALTDGMIAICEEVGEGKIEVPFIQQDSTLVESPYSGNSITDFRNNIIGLSNVYRCRYGAADGTGPEDLVAAGNSLLNSKIITQTDAAIASFDLITIPLEQAIYTQGIQLTTVQEKLAVLKTTLEAELRPWIIQHVR